VILDCGPHIGRKRKVLLFLRPKLVEAFDRHPCRGDD